MIWWLIPLVVTLAAWAWTRRPGAGRMRVRPRPEPGSPQDVEDLARFADALHRSMPGAEGSR